MASYTKEDLLEKIDVFTDTEEINDYVKIEVEKIEVISKGAAFLKCTESDEVIWIPYSNMRCDIEENIFVKQWFYNKNF